MSDPRATLLHVLDPEASYETFTADNSSITYSITETGGSTKVGLAVTLVSGLVETAAADEFILGKLIRVEKDLTCLVQVGGKMTLGGGNGATLTQGARIVGALNASSAEGYVKAAASGTAAHHVISRGFIIDATDTAAVVVRL